MRSGAIGCQKLGQPVPELNLARELNSSAPQQTQAYVPFAWLLSSLPENGGSVDFIRVTWNWPGVRIRAHSRSLLTPFRRFPPNSWSCPRPVVAEAIAST